MKYFDIHCHCYPDKVAAIAVENSQKKADVKVYSDATVKGLQKSARAANISGCLNLPVVMNVDSTIAVNEWAAKINNDVENFPEIYSLGSVHPNTKNIKDVLKWIRNDLGLKGIKLHPEYQKFKFEDLNLRAIWEGCIENNLFILTHTGRDISFPEVPNSNPRSLLQFHERYPELTLVLGHFGSWNLWDDIDLLIGQNLYLDTAFILPFLSKERIVEVIRKHGADKIIFGTDTPWGNQKKDLEEFDELPLTDAEKKLIFYENAKKLLDLK
ncbi:amidohydrolase family protein [Lentisphaerota bacterium WC36G]|nr:amidohydrolase family protein [Lentisphaerae bacterium WC36]